eukprot:3494546-Prymnesium_polylepis.1
MDGRTSQGLGQRDPHDGVSMAEQIKVEAEVEPTQVAESAHRPGVNEPNARTRRWKSLSPVPATATGSPCCRTHEASNVHHRRYA